MTPTPGGYLVCEYDSQHWSLIAGLSSLASNRSDHSDYMTTEPDFSGSVSFCTLVQSHLGAMLVPSSAPACLVHARIRENMQETSSPPWHPSRLFQDSAG